MPAKIRPPSKKSESSQQKTTNQKKGMLAKPTGTKNFAATATATFNRKIYKTMSKLFLTVIHLQFIYIQFERIRDVYSAENVNQCAANSETMLADILRRVCTAHTYTGQGSNSRRNLKRSDLIKINFLRDIYAILLDFRGANYVKCICVIFFE